MLPPPPPAAAPIPSVSLDPRRHAYRPDLADAALQDRVFAPDYATPVPAQIARPAVALRRSAGSDAPVDTEALLGEVASVFERSGGWAWVQLRRDGYVGYVEADALSTVIAAPTHRVSALGTYVYREPDIKSPPLMHLSLNAQVSVVGTGDRMAELRGGGFVVRRHLLDRDRFARDFVDIAERFIGTPYLWGGKTRLGIDCSGLVQISLEASGMPCPRDSDMQAAELGEPLAVPADFEGLRRGDLVCWPGHIGIMIDGVMLVHANAHHMSVAVEPLPEAAARIARTASAISAIRRLPSLGA